LRSSEITRETKETTIQISAILDGRGNSDIHLRPQFFNHVLTTMITYSGCDIKIRASGDLDHHIIEDVAICLGQVLRESIGNYASISRFGQSIVPMDDALALAAMDICNRPYAVIDYDSKMSSIEDTKLEDIEHFIHSLASSLRATIHVKVFYGMNEHHKIEAAFKALGFALRDAIQLRNVDSPEISTKGVL